VRAARLWCELILFAGVALTGRAAYLHSKAELAGILIRHAWQQGVQSGKSPAPWPWADTHPIARMRIPQLKYDEIVLEGATPRTLAFGPAHMLNGANFGKPGNVLLAGHRTSWFEPLKNISQGDRIEMEWFDAQHGGLHYRTYIVTTIQIVQPQDLDLLEPTSDDALTLITCYPFGHSPYSPQRFIVRAAPLAESHVVQGAAPYSSSRAR
jgi:sortase A